MPCLERVFQRLRIVFPLSVRVVLVGAVDCLLSALAPGSCVRREVEGGREGGGGREGEGEGEQVSGQR